jgi:proteic killer suppression protein
MIRSFEAMMIRSFRDKRAEQLVRGETPKGFPTDIVRSAQRKLFQIDNAVRLDDLRAPPGNRLEALQGSRAGQHSIRINDQWRICFRWTDTGPEDVEIVDYH